MKTNMQKTLGLGIALSLGLTAACVKVDVSVPSSGTDRHVMPLFTDEKPPISIAKLKERHAAARPTCNPSSFSRNIDGEKQQTAAWCWAASTRMVMEHYNAGQRTPTNLQCNIVNKTLKGRLGGTNCCQIRGTFDFVDAPTPDFIDAPLGCVRGAWPHWVFEAYRFDYEMVDTPLDWKVLTDELCSTKAPFISVIEWKAGGRHAYIVMGYSTTAPKGGLNPSPSQQYVRIYDPIPTLAERNFSEGDYSDIPFEEYVGDSRSDPNGHYGYFHDRDYVQISPKSKDQ